MPWRWLLSGALAMIALSTVTNARAFCRTTTCNCASAATCLTDCPRDAHRCETEGAPLAWSSTCVGFSLDIRGTSTLTADQWTDAVTQGFAAWAAVDCGNGAPPSIDLWPLRSVACGQSEYDPKGPNANVVYFDDDGWDGDDIDSALAVTSVHDADSGAIEDADMAFNSARHDFTVGDADVGIDLVSIATHEAGHFLGIDHSDRVDAVMYAKYAAGTLRRTLSSDDVSAVCAIYPPGRPAVCDPTPQGGLSTRCQPAGGCAVAAVHETSTTADASVLAFVGWVGVTGIRSRIRRSRRGR